MRGGEYAINLHTHTVYCHHAEGKPAEIAAAALERNIRVLGFSEHVPLPGGLLSDTRMAYDFIPEYFKELDEVEQQFPQIQFLRGFEGEYLPEYMEGIFEFLDSGTVEYLIGANHYFLQGEQRRRFPETSDPIMLKEVVRQFTDAFIRGRGRWLFFAHPDIFLRHGCPWDEESRAAAKDILECAKELKLPLEINAYGMRKKMTVDAAGVERYQYPVRPFWELAAEIGGIEVVANSDSHSPDSVWEKVPECIAWAEELGLKIVNKDLAEKLLKCKKN